MPPLSVVRRWLSHLFIALAIGCGGAQTAGPSTGDGRGDGGPALPPRDAVLGVNPATFVDGDPTLPSGAFAHLWRIALEPSQRVLIRMRSSQVDPMIEVRGPGGLRLRNDDGMDGSLDSIIELSPPEAGTYEILSTTYAARSMGAYELVIEPTDPRGVGEAYTLGTDLVSELGRAGRPGFPGSWIRFEGQGGSIVRLRITSRAFDTIATLMGPGGQTWVNDDANDLGPNGDERPLDSTIVAALPTSGVYQLIVTPYGGRGAGSFSVRSTVRPPVTLTENGDRPEGLAGPEGGGRVLGLYLGITAYQQQSQLYGCADDARLLAEAMRESHVQNATDQLVLPDNLATRQGFEQGVSQIASIARPEDVVLVFYSGHGNQVPDDDGDELDQLDETIVLFDGPMRDDEVVRSLERIGAGTVMLVLDSCFSGGFADDWVRQRGRVGIFSSDEDVLSDVAEPHRAGGYLSWHLRRGVLGEADSRPRDGVLHAGELTDYLNDGFVADHRLMNPDGGMDPAQRLVVRRGAVSWDRVLWAYPRNRDLSLPALSQNPLMSPPP
ncbi:MAG: caspase domain-containing protein [Sandaracinaceae bacterium]